MKKNSCKAVEKKNLQCIDEHTLLETEGFGSLSEFSHRENHHVNMLQ